jgi:hypothetical protein
MNYGLANGFHLKKAGDAGRRRKKWGPRKGGKAVGSEPDSGGAGVPGCRARVSPAECPSKFRCVETVGPGGGQKKPPPVPCTTLLRTRNSDWVPQVRGSDPTAVVGLQAPDSLLAPRGYSIGSSKESSVSRTPQRMMQPLPIAHPYSNPSAGRMQGGAPAASGRFLAPCRCGRRRRRSSGSNAHLRHRYSRQAAPEDGRGRDRKWQRRHRVARGVRRTGH